MHPGCQELWERKPYVRLAQQGPVGYRVQPRKATACPSHCTRCKCKVKWCCLLQNVMFTWAAHQIMWPISPVRWCSFSWLNTSPLNLTPAAFRVCLCLLWHHQWGNSYWVKTTGSSWLAAAHLEKRSRSWPISLTHWIAQYLDRWCMWWLRASCCRCNQKGRGRVSQARWHAETSASHRFILRPSNLTCTKAAHLHIMKIMQHNDCQNILLITEIKVAVSVDLAKQGAEKLVLPPCFKWMENCIFCQLFWAKYRVFTMLRWPDLGFFEVTMPIVIC